jgi:hypothetical protein
MIVTGASTGPMAGSAAEGVEEAGLADVCVAEGIGEAGWAEV